MDQEARQARLNDPGEHYPYKLEHVLDLIEQDAPAGPEGPDDTSTRVGEYISEGIALASNDYIEAQAAHLRENTPETAAAYRAAADRLVAERQAHRANRGSAITVVGVRRPISAELDGEIVVAELDTPQQGGGN